LGKVFSSARQKKNQEYRVSPVEWESGILSLISLFCEFLGRFLWLGRIRHSGYLGIKLWINNSLPQVWGYCSFFFFFAVIAIRLCRDICGKRRNFLLNETKIVLWQENDW